MLEKAVTIKRSEYSLLDKELKAYTEMADIGKKQRQRLDKAFISNKDNKNVNDSLIKKSLFLKQ